MVKVLGTTLAFASSSSCRKTAVVVLGDYDNCDDDACKSCRTLALGLRRRGEARRLLFDVFEVIESRRGDDAPTDSVNPLSDLSNS